MSLSSLNLEHVSGLSQLAVLQRPGSIADQAVTAERPINRTFAHTVLKPLWPALLLGTAAAALRDDALQLIARHTYLHRHGISKPRKPHVTVLTAVFLKLGGLEQLRWGRKGWLTLSNRRLKPALDFRPVLNDGLARCIIVPSYRFATHS